MDMKNTHDEEHLANAEQFLTFMLGKEEFGVEILRVEGIQGWDYATPIPNSPDYVLGVTNLRGAVVPIIDLRRRFELKDREFGPTTVVIVVKVVNPGQDRVIGMVVDGVSEVYSVNRQDIQPAPDFGGNVDTRFINGLATMDERLIILLNIDELLNEAASMPVASADDEELAQA